MTVVVATVKFSVEKELSQQVRGQHVFISVTLVTQKPSDNITSTAALRKQQTHFHSFWFVIISPNTMKTAILAACVASAAAFAPSTKPAFG